MILCSIRANTLQGKTLTSRSMFLGFGSGNAMALLGGLLAAPMRFCVEEKNQLRETLQGFGPLVVKRNDRDTETFFRLIMLVTNQSARSAQ
ncbi:hypothetical protein KJ359_009773 [Pestalotiopsis sp. 9143b]|nr:hypothetical protein KJ359_009773 [Pestalotiopsis sp. 9143b]